MAEKTNCKVFLNLALHISCFPQSSWGFSLIQEHLRTLNSMRGGLGVKPGVKDII